MTAPFILVEGRARQGERAAVRLGLLSTLLENKFQSISFWNF
jgi:hypothetical protein